MYRTIRNIEVNSVSPAGGMRGRASMYFKRHGLGSALEALAFHVCGIGGRP
jgi:hypothetical protein